MEYLRTLTSENHFSKEGEMMKKEGEETLSNSDNSYLHKSFCYWELLLAEPMTDPPTFLYSEIVDSTSYSPGNLEFKNYLVFNGLYSDGPDMAKFSLYP